MRGRTQNHFASSLSSECTRAANILDSFVNPDVVTLDKRIPRGVLVNAKGLAIFSVLKIGMLGSIRVGSGVVVARLPDGAWSAPSAITTGKLAVGQFGMELTNFIFVLNTDAAVDVFSRTESFTLGQQVSIALGPFGRTDEPAEWSNPPSIWAYSKTRSVFGGITLTGAAMGEQQDTNKNMYQAEVTPGQLLRGEIPPPQDAHPLMDILRSNVFCVPPSTPTVETRSQIPRIVPQALVTELPGDPVQVSRPLLSPSPSLSLELPPQPRNQTNRRHTAPSPAMFELFLEMQPTLSRHVSLVPSSGPSSVSSIAPSPAASTSVSPEPSSVSSRQTSPEQLLEKPPPPRRLSRVPTILTPGRRMSGMRSSWSRHDPLPF